MPSGRTVPSWRSGRAGSTFTRRTTARFVRTPTGRKNWTSQTLTAADQETPPTMPTHRAFARPGLQLVDLSGVGATTLLLTAVPVRAPAREPKTHDARHQIGPAL